MNEDESKNLKSKDSKRHQIGNDLGEWINNELNSLDHPYICYRQEAVSLGESVSIFTVQNIL